MIISAKDVRKTYDNGTEALKSVSIDVDKGDFYGLVGKNGAGKTTLIKILTGQINPDSGDISVVDIDPTTDSKQVRSLVGVLPEKESPMSFLTPNEYFSFISDVRDMSDEKRDERVKELSEMLNIEDKLDKKNRNLSRGQQQKVMLISAFIHEPELVFIDEPLANLDPIIQNTVKEFLKKYNDDGNTIVLSTHYTEATIELCSKVGVMADGKMIHEKNADNISTTEEIRDLLDTSDGNE